MNKRKNMNMTSFQILPQDDDVDSIIYSCSVESLQ